MGVAIEFARAVEGGRTVIDLGTGSGAIGLALATELPIDNTSIWMTDISPDALAVARANLAGIGRPARNVTIIESRWFDALPANLQADVIVSNPRTLRWTAQMSTEMFQIMSRKLRCTRALMGLMQFVKLFGRQATF